MPLTQQIGHYWEVVVTRWPAPYAVLRRECEPHAKARAGALCMWSTGAWFPRIPSTQVATSLWLSQAKKCTGPLGSRHLARTPLRRSTGRWSKGTGWSAVVWPVTRPVTRSRLETGKDVHPRRKHFSIPMDIRLPMLCMWNFPTRILHEIS